MLSRAWPRSVLVFKKKSAPVFKTKKSVPLFKHKKSVPVSKQKCPGVNTQKLSRPWPWWCPGRGPDGVLAVALTLPWLWPRWCPAGGLSGGSVVALVVSWPWPRRCPGRGRGGVPAVVSVVSSVWCGHLCCYGRGLEVSWCSKKQVSQCPKQNQVFKTKSGTSKGVQVGPRT